MQVCYFLQSHNVPPVKRVGLVARYLIPVFQSHCKLFEVLYFELLHSPSILSVTSAYGTKANLIVYIYYIKFIQEVAKDQVRSSRVGILPPVPTLVIYDSKDFGVGVGCDIRTTVGTLSPSHLTILLSAFLTVLRRASLDPSTLSFAILVGMSSAFRIAYFLMMLERLL